MNLIIRPTVLALLLLITALTAPVVAQQKRQPPKPQPKAAPTPAPTFDTLIPADTFIFYGEVRGVGELIRSSAMNDILEPVLKLAAPPKEFKTLVNWLNTHADEVMTSRLLVAAMSTGVGTGKDVPEVVIAIEFASAEEAAKFAAPLNQVLAKVVPESVVDSPPESSGEKTKATRTTKPNYYLQQAGPLVVITPKPLKLKQLKPAGSKRLADDNNFRVARNRFNSEPVFVYADLKAMERQDEERRKQYEEAARAEAERVQKEKAAAGEESKKTEEEPPAVELSEEEKAAIEAAELARIEAEMIGPDAREAPTPDPVSMGLMMLGTSFFAGDSKWPEAIGLALSLESDSFDLKALFVNPPGEKTPIVPFVPMLIPGAPFVPESPNILPADSELLLTVSLDLPQVYAAMSKPRPNPMDYSRRGNVQNVNEETVESPFAAIEKQLQLNIKDDVLPLLGSEIAVRLPVKDFSLPGLIIMGGPTPSSGAAPSPKTGPLVAISLRDKEAVRVLMPKIIEAVGFKGASALAQTEKREDTEIVSYAGFFSYAFIGNFLVLSGDPATIKHVVDSYLKQETLSGDSNFRNFTRWQPRPLQGQVYISPALMETLKTWAEQSRVSDQTRAFLTRLSAVAQPVTYSLSNEGLGPVHELHLPRNLVLMAAAGISSEANPPPTLVNERRAMGSMHAISYAERRYKEEKGGGSYGTLEQLIAEEMVTKDMLEGYGYRLDLTVTGDKFEVSAVPVEYGKSGIMSYFIDQTGVLRGADRNGASATSSDPPVGF